MRNEESQFYNFNTKNLNYFNLITLVFKKSTATKKEWDNLFFNVDNLFDTINSKYVLIVDISSLYFPGVDILKKLAEILRKYPNNIDKYCIETSIIIPTTVLAKTTINALFTFYKSRRPVHIKYSFKETYDAVFNTVNQFTEN